MKLRRLTITTEPLLRPVLYTHSKQTRLCQCSWTHLQLRLYSAIFLSRTAVRFSPEATGPARPRSLITPLLRNSERFSPQPPSLKLSYFEDTYRFQTQKRKGSETSWLGSLQGQPLERKQPTETLSQLCLAAATTDDTRKWQSYDRRWRASPIRGVEPGPHLNLVDGLIIGPCAF